MYTAQLTIHVSMNFDKSYPGNPNAMQQVISSFPPFSCCHGNQNADFVIIYVTLRMFAQRL